MEQQPNEWIEPGKLEGVVDAICERGEAEAHAVLGRFLLWVTNVQVRSKHE